MRLGARLTSTLIASAAAAAACTNLAATYTCAESTECVRSGVAGVCESTGYCSFDDATCPTGRRYGAFAAPALAEGCVDGVGVGATDGPLGDAGPDAGPGPGCPPLGAPGPVNAAGDVGSTVTYTDWFFPESSQVFEWTLTIDQEVERDGYFWAHQFFFFDGPEFVSGWYFGLQAHGTYRPAPPSPATEIRKIAVFSVGGAALDAELGDLAYPDARVENSFDDGAGWNIHARYAWEPCRTYRLRIAEGEVEVGGDRWYGASIRDELTGVATYIGRIKVPARWTLYGSSVMFTERFGPGAVVDCATQEHVSAVFGRPVVEDLPVIGDPGNHFSNPVHCPTSRFTVLPGGDVRHEQGVPGGP